eukprot:sb/3472792/
MTYQLCQSIGLTHFSLLSKSARELLWSEHWPDRPQFDCKEPTETSKQPIRTRDWLYQPIRVRDQYFLIRSVHLSEHWPDPILASLSARELWSEHWPDSGSWLNYDGVEKGQGFGTNTHLPQTSSRRRFSFLRASRNEPQPILGDIATFSRVGCGKLGLGF